MGALMDLWPFFQPFVFGAIGGWAAILMSGANRKAALAETKSKLVLKYKTSGESVYTAVSDAFDEATKVSIGHTLYTTFVSCLVGGISGMIAVNAFNTEGTASQTFSIAVIAGVSGFAFLKRSALIDDGNSDNLVGVESTFLEDYIEAYIVPLDEAEEITSRFTSDTTRIHPSLTNELIEELFPEESLVEVPPVVPNTQDAESFEAFIRDFRDVEGVTESDVNYLRHLHDGMGMSLSEILEIIDSSEE